MTLKSGLKARLPSSLVGAAVGAARGVHGLRARRSWSQTGEDLLVLDAVGASSTGYYVDVGAFHPRLGSNTKLLYDRGWRGMNLDARPGSMRAFRRWRRRDINLEVGVGATDGEVEFFRFADSELDTFDAGVAAARAQSHRLIDRRVLPVRTLTSLFREYRVPQDLDLLTIDCEGWELAVLTGLDWDAYRPKVVVTEVHGAVLDDRLKTPPPQFLADLGYRAVAATSLSVVLVAT